MSRTVSVAAGKGGTGKTLVATSLALALHARAPGRVSLLDCDVEEPNAHLLLRPAWESEEPVCIRTPEIDLDACTRCGACAAACHANAIAVIRDAVLVFPEMCSGCGLCTHVCPVQAIHEVDRSIGTVQVGHTEEGLRVVSGRLAVGHHRAARLVHAVREQRRPDDVTVIDAPPGTACPMQAAVEGADQCWLVTEPTPFGRSDLAAAQATCEALGVAFLVILNRDGIGGARDDVARRSPRGVALWIPHDRRIAEAYAQGITLVAAQPEWAGRLLNVWDRANEGAVTADA